MKEPENCVCLDGQCNADAFESTEVSRGRVGEMRTEIELRKCKQCGRNWLHYTLEHETSGAWGKWYRGLITSEMAALVTPETAVSMFAGLEWHIYGGTYYGTAGERSIGPVHVPHAGGMSEAA